MAVPWSALGGYDFLRLALAPFLDAALSAFPIIAEPGIIVVKTAHAWVNGMTISRMDACSFHARDRGRTQRHDSRDTFKLFRRRATLSGLHTSVRLGMLSSPNMIVSHALAIR